MSIKQGSAITSTNQGELGVGMARTLPPEAASSSDDDDFGDADLDAAANLGRHTTEAHTADIDSLGHSPHSDDDPVTEEEDDVFEDCVEIGSDWHTAHGSSSDQSEGASDQSEAKSDQSQPPGDSAKAMPAPANGEPAGPFKSKEKGAAIAKAFAKVTRGRTEDRSAGAAILSGSKSLLKRQRVEAVEEAADHKAHALRREMRKRGHATVPRIGDDHVHDATEKLLLRTARKGVVRLFNAVSKAQKQAVELQAVGGRSKGQQLTKADFLAELRGKSKVSSKPIGASTAKKSEAIGISPSVRAAASDVPSWAPLRDDDFNSLSSGLKMKDWDKSEVQPDLPEETLVDEAGSDSD